MDLILVGPGRAGSSLALRSIAAGHRIVGVLARDAETSASAAERLESVPLQWGSVLPTADLLVLAVRDDAISEVAELLSSTVGDVDGAVHVSGSVPISALGALDGPMLGSFHPLQTLPNPEAGAARLEGAWVGVTANEDYLADRLFSLATSLGMHPFELDDAAKPLYHAAAAAAANYPLAALAMSRRLFDAAGVPFAAARPLVEAVVANAFELGPQAALTGPIVRGDLGTVRSQLAAIEATAPELLTAFKTFGRLTAAAVGASDEMGEVLA